MRIRIQNTAIPGKKSKNIKSQKPTLKPGLWTYIVSRGKVTEKALDRVGKLWLGRIRGLKATPQGQHELYRMGTTKVSDCSDWSDRFFKDFC
jgi:hypothetical protein